MSTQRTLRGLMRVSGWWFLLRTSAVMLVSCGMAVSAYAQTFSALASLSGVNGNDPYDAVIQSTNGNFYATTADGGVNGSGDILEITPEGLVTNLYSFCSLPNCTDGAQPQSSLILGSDDNIYGTTFYGGNSDANAGTFFRVSPDGKLRTLYNFCTAGFCDDGINPNGLIQASNGDFYGAAQQGGANQSGSIFEITSAGQFKLVYTFCAQAGCSDGEFPTASPIQGSNGNFYGTTAWGGSNGVGAVYELTPGGSYRVLYSFCLRINCTDGAVPNSLVQDASGSLYGTTNAGGAIGANKDGYGIVFKITPTNQYIVLHTFEFSDGAYPFSGLIVANDGNLYGAAPWGGGGGGNIFQITPDGVFTILHSFCSGGVCTGSHPNAIFQGTNGIFYGTTASGGAHNYGTVFSLNNNLTPLVETVPTMGKVGTRVIILGNNLTGSSSVTFNGVAAAFTVESDTYIEATVPTSATTGTVSVDTPSGTLKSNPQFVVAK